MDVFPNDFLLEPENDGAAIKVAVVSADAFRKFLRVLVFISFLGFILLQVQNSISWIHIIQNSQKSKFLVAKRHQLLDFGFLTDIFLCLRNTDL